MEHTEDIAVVSCSLGQLMAEEALVASDGSSIAGRLNLPEYQRPYRWGERELERLVEDLRHFFAPEHHTEHDFYLGSVILHYQAGSEGHCGVLNIIDGQQRLTTMGLLAFHLSMRDLGLPQLEFKFRAPESQHRIRTNLQWLKDVELPHIDFHRVNLTLVITRSEDDAYRFFETQNTGGIRLSGPDIIKAHHLRATRHRQNAYAVLWEEMGELAPLVDAVMKARHWKQLDFRELSSHRQPSQVRAEIVAELAERTESSPRDIAYRHAQVIHDDDGRSQRIAIDGYSMRQPLHAGLNAIHYLKFFHTLRQKLLIPQKEPLQGTFGEVYKALIVEAGGSVYLRKLYDSAILLYVSRYGHRDLYEASLWLFRVAFSRRLSNQKTVRESSVQAFARETPLLDWIAYSYHHAELLAFLRGFHYHADSSNLDTHGVKARFVKKVADFLNFRLPGEAKAVAESYDKELQKAIYRLTRRSQR